MKLLDLLHKVKLRDYQIEALAAIKDALDAGNHPVCSVAAGGGKSILIAALASTLPGRILIVTHRKVLISQDELALRKLGIHDAGIYSAGLKRRDLSDRVVFAGLQSIYKRMDELQAHGAIRYILWDEAHMCAPPENPNAEKGSKKRMSNVIFEACPDAQRVGFSATPYRMDDGPIYADNGLWFNCMPSHVGVTDLTEMGYLSRLTGVKTAIDADLSSVKVRHGDYVSKELSEVMQETELVQAAVEEIVELSRHRKSLKVFCVDQAHCETVTRAMQDAGIDAEFVTGKTRSEEEALILERFQKQNLRALISCEKFTTGFDVPCIDCVVLLRPSQSKSLVVQSICRGTRLSPETGKFDCLVLDLAGNLEKHMPIDGIPKVIKSPRQMSKEEKEEQEKEKKVVERPLNHGTRAARMDPLGSSATVRLKVLDVTYLVKPAKKYPDRDNLIAIYKCVNDQGVKRSVSRWVLVEYPGRAGAQARDWFERRGLAMPRTARDALKEVRKSLTKPIEIVVKKDGDYDRVLSETF